MAAAALPEWQHVLLRDKGENKLQLELWRFGIYFNLLFLLQYHCCGRTGPLDYPSSGLRLPASCYLNQNSSIASDLFHDGCNTCLSAAFVKGTSYERISDWSVVGLEVNAFLDIIILRGYYKVENFNIALLQLLTVIVSGLFAITLQNAQRRRLYR